MYREEIYKTKKDIEKIGNGYDVFSTITGRIALFFILALAAKDVLDPDTNFDTNDLVIVLLFYQLIQSPIQELMRAWSHIYESEPVLKRIKEVLDMPTENRHIIQGINSPMIDGWETVSQDSPSQRSSKKLIDNVSGIHLDDNVVSDNWKEKKQATPLVEFRNLIFAYPNTDTNVLDNVSFKIFSNTVNVVIGESKLGKSTIFRLILQLYHQYHGDILINNCDARNIAVDQLRQKIGLVPQGTDFFRTRKFKDNIRVANAKATDEIIIDRLNSVELGDLSAQLEQQVRIDELSGGTQKRIAGVRCLVREEEPLLYTGQDHTYLFNKNYY